MREHILGFKYLILFLKSSSLLQCFIHKINQSSIFNKNKINWNSKFYMIQKHFSNFSICLSLICLFIFNFKKKNQKSFITSKSAIHFIWVCGKNESSKKMFLVRCIFSCFFFDMFFNLIVVNFIIVMKTHHSSGHLKTGRLQASFVGKKEP